MAGLCIMDHSAKPIFNFVNLSHPDELKDEKTQLRIRRLAMTEVGKARRKPKTKRERNEIILEFRNPASSPTTIDRLGGGELDPFSPYPIDLDETSRGLIAFSKSPDHGVLRRLLLSNSGAYHSSLPEQQHTLSATQRRLVARGSRR